MSELCGYVHIYHFIDTLFSEYPSAETVVLGDVNVHTQDWLGSTNTVWQVIIAKSFVISNTLTNLINEPTYVPRVHLYDSNFLDLFPTTRH